MRTHFSRILICWLAVLAAQSARADDTPGIPLRYPSPDRSLTAIVVPLGRDLGAKEIPGDAEYECRVDIYNSQGRRISSQDYGSPDNDHGRGVAFAMWSPDSHWFVYSTISSGGHHPWQYFTYAYDRTRNALFLLDDFVGEVIDQKFTFAKPCIITVKIFDRTIKDPKEDWPSKTVTANLDKLLAHKKPQ